MYVIRLASGNLLVPEFVVGQGGLIGDAYVEIGPDHADYSRLAGAAISEQDDRARREHWRQGDESLRREFLDYLARHGADGGWHDD